MAEGVIVTDCSPVGISLYEADAFYLVLPMKDPGYEDRILEICMREQVNALLPLFEDELDLLAQNRKKFEEKGITAIVSDAESVAVCRDKYGFFLPAAEKRTAGAVYERISGRV